jgi:ABC-type nitrate/sulfonate/bicarbonate transport system substrate-binding protein
MKKHIFVLLALILIFSSCRRPDKKIELIEGWFPWTGYIGGLYAMERPDSIYDIDFKIVDGADNIDPVQLVLADKYLFGVAGAEAIIAANVNTGADLVAIGVVNYKSATCFLSLPNVQVKTPEDFQDKTIGVLSGTETETIYKAIKKKYNLKIDSINHEVEAPYDLQTFLLKKYDIRPGFVYDEAVTLEMKGIQYNILLPERFGISTLGGVYFTRRKTIEENQNLVQKVVNSLARGWEWALQNPTEGVRLLYEHDPKNIDLKREIVCFQKGMDYFKGEGDSVLYASNHTWKNFESLLKDIGRVNSDFDIKSSYDNSFILRYFKDKK